MKKIKTLIYLTVANFTLSNAIGQELASDYYSFVMNMYNVNPAYTGYNEGLSGVLNVRNNATTFNGSPKNIMAGVYSTFGANQAIGARLISDSRGAFSIVRADITYAYTVNLNDNHRLTFGISEGALNRNFSPRKINNYSQIDANDPSLINNELNVTRFSVGAGALYRWKGLELSASSPHLIVATEALSKYMHFAARYNYKIGSTMTISPWLSYQNIPVTDPIMGYFLKGAFLNERAWAQLGYQTNSTLNIAAGVKFKEFELGYNYQSSNKAMQNITSGVHQIVIHFTYNKNKNNTTKQESEPTTITPTPTPPSTGN